MSSVAEALRREFASICSNHPLTHFCPSSARPDRAASPRASGRRLATQGRLDCRPRLDASEVVWKGLGQRESDSRCAAHHREEVGVRHGERVAEQITALRLPARNPNHRRMSARSVAFASSGADR